MALEVKPEEIGKRVRDARVAAGLSQEGLGRLTGLSRETIRRVEAGKVVPDGRTVMLLAAYTKTDPNHLLGFDDSDMAR